MDLKFASADGPSIATNFSYYQHAAPGVVRHDIHHCMLRPAMFDAVVTDPPYGCRARARTLGNKSGSRAEAPQEEHQATHQPQTTVVAQDDIVSALLALCARVLVPGGRVVFWMPKSQPFIMPTHS